MIKKISVVLLTMLLLISTNAFAGDIPESIMLGEQKALFIGKITAIGSDTYEVTPLTVMMGSIEEPVLQIEKFDKYYGTTLTPALGDFIVAVLLDHNTIDPSWVFKSTTEDYTTLNLVSEQFGMVARYRQYINDGKYFDAQKKLDDNSQSTASTDTGKDPIITIKTTDNNTKEQPTTMYAIVAIFSAFLITGTVLYVKRKPPTTKL